MKKIFFLSTVVILFTAFVISCIDRDTIAGTGKELPYRIINIGGTLQEGQVTAKLPDPLVVRVVAENGRPVRGVFVEFYFEGENASLSDTNKTTDGDGYAQTYVTLGTKADSIYVYADVLGIRGSPVKFSLYASVSSNTNPKPTKPWMKILDGNNQTGTVGNRLSKQLSVKVLDVFDNPVPKMMIRFSTTNGSLSPDSVLTDAQGLASSFWTLDTTVGTQTVQAVCHEILGGSVQFNATGVALLVPTYFTRLCSDTFFTLQGLTINRILHVNVLDQYGNPVYTPFIPGFLVHFYVTEGFGRVDAAAATEENGDAFAGATLANNDSIMKITADVGFNVPKLKFTFFAYKYLQIDSVRSAGGVVTLFWQKNMNLHFANYTIQRCTNLSFDGTTVNVKVISVENITSAVDTTAVVGNTYIYRIKVNYTNGYNFYTNMREVKVSP